VYAEEEKEQNNTGLLRLDDILKKKHLMNFYLTVQRVSKKDGEEVSYF
jgi:hypothetical protein